jgi:hypothetical protein
VVISIGNDTCRSGITFAQAYIEGLVMLQMSKAKPRALSIR